MKLALVQLDIRWEDKETNLTRAAEFVKEAAEEGNNVVVFPEMFSTGFSMNVQKIAEEREGPTMQQLSLLACKHKIAVIAGYAEAAGSNKARNVAVVFDHQGKELGRYTKNHPFSFAKEDQHYVPGTESIFFNIQGFPASVFICYDLRFPEIFRGVAPSVELIFVIANWPSVRQDHWESLLKARAIENQCFVIGLNRIGRDGNGLEYIGGSHVFSPLGVDLRRGKAFEEYFSVTINPLEVKKTRQRLPFLKDIK